MVYSLGRQLDTRKRDHFRFFKEVIKFRCIHHVFRRENFLNKVNLFLLSLFSFEHGF